MIDRLLAWIEYAAASWEQGKHGLERYFWYQADSLHVVVGLLLVSVFALALRKSLASPIPLGLLLLVSSLNEGVDIYFTRYVAESVKDTLLTMLLPTVLLVATRNFPALFVRPPVSATKAGE